MLAPDRRIQLLKQVFDYVAVYVGESEVATLIVVGELGVVDSKLIENCGLEIVNVDCARGEIFDAWIDDLAVFIDDVVAKIIGVAVDHAGFDSAAGHPDGEGSRVVITAVIIRG